MNALAPSFRSGNDESAPIDAPLSFRCPFLGCSATRLFEGGRPFLFTHLDTCVRCEMRIAVTAEENAFAKLVARGLI